MRSMTGYGEAAAESARHAVSVSLRAVNHRFLDLQVRLADEGRGSEAALRDLVGRERSRGRVEVRGEGRAGAVARLAAGGGGGGGGWAAIRAERLKVLAGGVVGWAARRGRVGGGRAAAPRRRLAELRGAPLLDGARLAEEVALLVDRSD